MELFITVSKGDAVGHLAWVRDKPIVYDGADDIVFEMQGMLYVGRDADHNPLLGGPYVGYDPTDPIQVIDGLRSLERKGFVVDIDDSGVDYSSIPHNDYLFTVDPRSKYAALHKARQNKGDAADYILSQGQDVGVFVRVPEQLAKRFPDQGPRDNTPTHLTILYVGDVSSGRWDDLVYVVHRVFDGQPAFKARYTGKGYVTPHGSYAARADVSPALHTLRNALRDLLRAQGFTIQDYGADNWIPHTKLSHNKTYPGPIPSSDWLIDRVEIWGLPWSEKINLPTNTPMGKGRVFSDMLSLIKAKKGEEVAGHDYKSRDPLPGGGFRYHYFDETGKAQHHDYPEKHPIHAAHEHLKTTEEDIAQHRAAINSALDKLPEGTKVTTRKGRTFSKKDGKWHHADADPVKADGLVTEAAKEAKSTGMSKDDYIRAFKASLWSFIQGAVPGEDPHWRVRFAKKDAKQQEEKKGAEPDTKETKPAEEPEQQTKEPEQQTKEPEPEPKSLSDLVADMESELDDHQQALKDVARHALVSKELEAARRSVQAARAKAGLTEEVVGKELGAANTAIQAAKAESKPEKAEKVEKAESKPEASEKAEKPEKAESKAEKAESKPEKAESKPEKAESKPEKAESKPESK